MEKLKRKKNIKISASIMCADLGNLEEECLKLELAGVDRIHIDIMDGMFVNNIVFGFPFIKMFKKITNLPLECHLMINKPEKFIELLLENEADFINVHIESTNSMNSIIDSIKNNNKKIGIVLNPETDFECINKFLKEIDLIVFMTVNPGFAGQKFDSKVINKIIRLKNFIDKKGFKIELEADGHMDETTIPIVVNNGIQTVVLGSSSLFKGVSSYKNYRNIVSMIRNLIN
jgi:ribulose-phosphate 3-epimerase